MSDNDCVSRKAVYRLADDLWHLMFNLEEDGDCIDMDAVAEKIHELAKLSPAEQPMSAVEFLRALQRRADAENYTSVMRFVGNDWLPPPDFSKWVEDVEKWTREHPEEKNDERQGSR